MTNRSAAQRKLRCGRPSIKTKAWTTAAFTPSIQLQWYKSILGIGIKSAWKNNVWHRRTMWSVKYQRQKRASLFQTLVSYNSQLSRRMLVCVWVKQLRRRASIVRVSDCVNSVGTKCLQSQRSRWTYKQYNVELVPSTTWCHRNSEFAWVGAQGRRRSASAFAHVLDAASLFCRERRH